MEVHRKKNIEGEILSLFLGDKEFEADDDKVEPCELDGDFLVGSSKLIEITRLPSSNYGILFSKQFVQASREINSSVQLPIVVTVFMQKFLSEKKLRDGFQIVFACLRQVECLSRVNLRKIEAKINSELTEKNVHFSVWLGKSARFRVCRSLISNVSAVTAQEICDIIRQKTSKSELNRIRYLVIYNPSLLTMRNFEAHKIDFDEVAIALTEAKFVGCYCVGDDGSGFAIKGSDVRTLELQVNTRQRQAMYDIVGGGP